MPDTYSSFLELAHHERRNVDYQIVACARPSPVLILALHGGGIEPGTSELAKAIAGDAYSYYCFEGRKPSGNEILHVASEAFDEPQAIELVNNAQLVLSLHGCARAGKCVYIGGCDELLGGLVGGELRHAGIAAQRDDSATMGGKKPLNICNRGRSGRGCQLEITEDLRRAMFEGWTQRGRARHRPLFHAFGNAIVSALVACEASPSQ